MLGIDRMVPATAIQNSTVVTEYSVSWREKNHMAPMAITAEVWRRIP